MKKMYIIAVLAIMTVALALSAAPAADNFKVGDVIFVNPPAIRPGDVSLGKNGYVSEKAFSQLIRARLTYIGTVESCPVVSLDGPGRSELVIYDLIEKQKVVLIAWEAPDYWHSRVSRKAFYSRYALFPPERKSYSLNFYTHNHYFKDARVRISGVGSDGKEKQYELRLKHRWIHGHSWEKRLKVPKGFYVRQMTVYPRGRKKIRFRVYSSVNRDGYVYVLLSSLPEALTCPRIEFDFGLNTMTRWPNNSLIELRMLNAESFGASPTPPNFGR